MSIGNIAWKIMSGICAGENAMYLLPAIVHASES